MNRRNFIQSVGAAIAALVASAIDKYIPDVVQCSQVPDTRWRLRRLAVPQKPYTGWPPPHFRTNDLITITMDGESAQYQITSVHEIDGEVLVGLAPLKMWLPLI